MARILNEKEFSQRRNDILDSAQRFAYTKGFEQMSIQDILDDLKISKGAFYHYFDSKSALLEALVDRILGGVMKVIMPIIEDSRLDAVEKLHRYFDAGQRWKSERKDFLLGLFRIWYTDENAVLRQRITAATLKVISPLITRIIRQGIDEEQFDTDDPQAASEVVLTLLQGMGDAMATIILSRDPGPGAQERLEKIVQVYTASLERVLGLKPGRLHLIDMQDMDQWISVAQPTAQS